MTDSKLLSLRSPDVTEGNHAEKDAPVDIQIRGFPRRDETMDC
jgi:hypothetical protein